MLTIIASIVQVLFFLSIASGSSILNDFSSTNMTNSKIAIRSIKPITPETTIILGIPGGPGITGAYMDQPIAELANFFHVNGAVIDLPNHGLSGRNSDAEMQFDYKEARTMLISMLQELSAKNIKIILYGHSFGGLISMDLMRDQSVQIEHAVIVSVPTSWKNTSEFTQFLKESDAENLSWANEAAFQLWWRKILPAYFAEPIPNSLFEKIAAPTHWIGNEHFNEGMDSFDVIASDIVKLKMVDRIDYFEGERELVLPAKNFDKVRSSLPGVRTTRLIGTGHFPMLDKNETILKTLDHKKFQCRTAFSSL